MAASELPPRLIKYSSIYIWRSYDFAISRLSNRFLLFRSLFGLHPFDLFAIYHGKTAPQAAMNKELPITVSEYEMWAPLMGFVPVDCPALHF
jgi:hypothetical protein